MTYILKLFFINLLSIAAQSQDNKIAIIQYSSGSVTLKDSQVKLDYPDLVKNGDTISIAPNSTLKLYFKNKCIVTFYDENTVTTKSDEVAVESGKLRAQCPTPFKIQFKSNLVQIESGEILIDDKDIYLVSGSATVNQKPIEPFIDENQMVAWDKEFPLFKESYRHSIIDAKPKNYTFRTFLMYSPLGIGGTNHKFQQYDFWDRDVESVRLATHFKLFNKDLLAFIGFMEHRNPDDSGYMVGPPPIGYNNSSSEFFFVGVGQRIKNFKESHSPYYYLALAQQSIQYSVKDTISSEYFGNIVYYDAVLGLGYDKIFFVGKRFAGIIGIEAVLFQSLGPGWEQRKSSFGSPRDNPKSEQTSYAVLVYFGPVVQF